MFPTDIINTVSTVPLQVEPHLEYGVSRGLHRIVRPDDPVRVKPPRRA